MTILSSYVTTTRDFTNDPNGLFWTTTQMNDYVNRGRRRVALDAQCVRVLPPSSGAISTAVAGATGSGYTSAPTVTVSLPDAANGGTQAVLTASTPVAGAITGYTIVTAGSGYVAPPTITLSGGGGANATCVVTLSTMVRTIPGQETYAFSSINAALQLANAGVQSVIGVQSISASWGNMKPTLGYRAWTDFQALYRAYNIGNQNYPQIWAQYGRGQGAQAYLWPIPNAYVSMDWDCYCQPIPLVDDTTVDAVPDPYTECVPYYAAHLAFANAQRKDDAEYYKQMYVQKLIDCGVYTTPSFSPSAYDGDW